MMHPDQICLHTDQAGKCFLAETSSEERRRWISFATGPKNEMPRKSAAELATVSNIQDHRPRISAPPGMSPEETALFRKIVEDCHPLHFAQSDAPLLRSYCQAIILGDLAFEAAQQSPDALGDWEKCCRTMAALSVKLRLSPHSRSDPKTVMRAIAGQSLREIGVSLESLAAIRAGERGWTCKG